MMHTNQQLDKSSERWLLLGAGLQLLAVIGLLAVLLRDNWRSFPFTRTWNISDRFADKHQVLTVTIDDRGNPWFIIQKRIGVGYQVRHVTPERTDSWEFPPMSIIEMSRASVAVDKNNYPWLILGTRLAHWDGNEWNFIPMPLDAEILDLVCPTVVIRGSMVWGIDNATEQTRIIQLNLNVEPVQAQEIRMPEGLDAQQYGLDCIISAENGFLAAVSDETQVAFFQWKNEQWQEITSFKKTQASNVFLNDIALDSKGQIWVVRESWIQGEPVGKYDPVTDTWTWLNVEQQPELNDRMFDYGHIAVDDLGRVWISTTQYKAAGTILSSFNYETDAVGVYEERENNLVEIRHYTSKNSSLDTSLVAKMLVGPDQKIWTWSQQLVWMDSAAVELPTPLPNWIVTLTSHGITISIMFTSLAMYSLVLIIQVYMRRKRQYPPKR